MRGVAVVLVVMVLAGCLEQERSQETVPPVEELPGPTYEPVSIHEDIDLLEGLPMTAWNFTFGPGATGTIQARLMGPEAMEQQRAGGGFCWRFEVTAGGTADAGRHCMSQDGLSLSNGPAIELLDHHVGGAGQAKMEFRSDPQVGRFVLDVEITYD